MGAGVGGRRLKSRRVTRAPFLLAVLAALAFSAPAGAGSAALSSDVWFLQDGKPTAVERSAPGIPGIVRALLAGPTRKERSQGLRTAIPGGTAIRDLRISRQVVTVDLAARFTAGRDETSLQSRVGQLVRTLRAVPGVLGVRVRIEGGVPIGLFPGYDLRRTVREPVPEQHAPGLRDAQELLAALGFMAPTGVTGQPGDETSVAVLAFQKWSGLPRTGALDAQVTAALLRATRPVPALRRPGKRVEILLARQVALEVVDDRVERVFHISSGAGGRTPSGVVPRLPQGAHVVVGAVLDLDAVGELLHRRDRPARVPVGPYVPRFARLRPDDGPRRAVDVRVRDVRDAGRRRAGVRVSRATASAAAAVLAALALAGGVGRRHDARPPLRPPRPGRSSSRSASATRRCRPASCGAAR